MPIFLYNYGMPKTSKTKSHRVLPNRRVALLWAIIGLAGITGTIYLQASACVNSCSSSPLVTVLIFGLLALVIVAPIFAIGVIYRGAWNSPRRVGNMVLVTVLLISLLVYLQLTRRPPSPHEQQTIQCLKTSSAQTVSKCP
jgi:hypothetical protein